jgi:hypothetical protein
MKARSILLRAFFMMVIEHKKRTGIEMQSCFKSNIL